MSQNSRKNRRRKARARRRLELWSWKRIHAFCIAIAQYTWTDSGDDIAEHESFLTSPHGGWFLGYNELGTAFEKTGDVLIAFTVEAADIAAAIDDDFEAPKSESVLLSE